MNNTDPTIKQTIKKNNNNKKYKKKNPGAREQ